MNDKDRNLLDQNNDQIKPETDINTFLISQTNISETKVADLLYYVGDDKTYQKFVIFAITMIGLMSVFLIYGLVFLYMEPKFNCYNQQGLLYSCSKTEACNNFYGFAVSYDRKSIVSEFQLYCNREALLNTGRSAFVLSGSIGAVVLIFLTGIIGRLFVIYISFVLFTTGAFISYFTTSLFFMFAGMSFAIAGFSASAAALNIYINETIGGLIRFKST